MSEQENGFLDMTDAGFNIGVNVRITKRDKRTGRILETREGHNRCLKMQLMGIVKWLNGEFNDTQPFLLHYDWIPRYLAVGTNIASGGSGAAGVTSEVTVNDTQLLHELSPRIKLPERNKIINRSTQSYIQLIIATYLPEKDYVGETIGEAGLFSKDSGNNCLFRITFEPIVKEEDTVVEVNWTISVISLESTGEPYEDIDKVDLRQAMNHLLDKFNELAVKGTKIDYTNMPLPTGFKLGDINMDNYIDQNDIDLLDSYLKDSENTQLSAYQLKLANCNEDSDVNEDDLTALTEYVQNPEASETNIGKTTVPETYNIIEHFQGGIYDYGRSDISQIEVDQRTQQLTEDYNELTKIDE